MAEFTMAVGSRRPSISYVLRDDAGQVIDLTAGVTGVTFRGAQTNGTTVFSGACTITTAAAGLVNYAWGANDTAIAGIYRVQFVITWTAGTLLQVVPTNRTLTLSVVEATT